MTIHDGPGSRSSVNHPWLSTLVGFGLILVFLSNAREPSHVHAADERLVGGGFVDYRLPVMGGVGQPADKVIMLVLYDALENQDLEILIPRRENRFGAAIALTPRWNQSSHEVELSDLRLEAGKLWGKLTVSLHPNATWPIHGKMPAAVVKIDAEVREAAVSGSFECLYDGVTAPGKLGGSVDAVDLRLLQDCDVTLRLEKPTPIETERWKKQVSFCIAQRGGKAASARVTIVPNEPSPAKSVVDVDASGICITANTVSGEIETARPGEPALHFRLHGIVVGRQIGGMCEVLTEGRTERRRVRGEIRPPAKQSSRPEKNVSPRAAQTVLPPQADELDAVIELARKTLALVNRSEARPQLAAELDALESRAKQSRMLDDAGRKELCEAFGQLRRRIILSHPALAFDRLLINKRSAELPEHMVDQYLGRHSKPGPGLVILESWKDNPAAVPLTANRLPAGAVIHPDLSYDGRRVLFAFCDPSASGGEEYRAYHIYEMTFATGEVRQVTGTPADLCQTQKGRQTVLIEDIDPCYLPDGGVAFISTRGQTFGRCNGVRYSPSYTLHRCELDGTKIRPLSFNEANDWGPCVLNDGLLVFTRWDYINRPDVLFQSLWTTRPDGTATAHYYKNNSPFPCLVGETRPIPGSHKVVATAAAHHGQTLGSIIVIDPHRGQDGGEPLTAVTPELPFPEAQTPSGTTPTPLPLPADRPKSQQLSEQRAGTPFPLTEDLFLAAYPHEGRLAIYLIDTLGGRELIYCDPQIACMDPIPLRPRTMPPVIVATSPGKRESPTARFYVQDVYQGAYRIARGTVKSLRVNEIIGQPARAKPSLGCVGNEIVKRIIGTVPVNDDGSVAFEAPAATSMQFQLLDADGMAVMTMRSQVYAQPGESVSCIGCHEPRCTAPPVAAKANAAEVRQLTPSVGPSYEGGLSYARTVQPVLDRYCIACHGLEKIETVDLLGTLHDVSAEGAPPPSAFSVSYESLMGIPGLVRIAQRNQESYPSRPKDYFAHAGRLAKMLLQGHPDKDGRKLVELDAESLQRMIDWLDLNAQYYGDYSFNRGECQSPCPEGEQALRAAISKRFGPELARQPFAALVNTALPQESRILKAPLSIQAGGWGQISTRGWKDTDDSDYRAMARLVEASITPLTTHDIAGTCGREEGCRCGCCWVRKASQPQIEKAEAETR